MFFVPCHSGISECIFIQTYFLSGSAYANTAWANICNKNKDPFFTAMDLRPEVLLEAASATDQAIKALEGIQGYPCNMPETEFGIAEILKTLKTHMEYLQDSAKRGDDLRSPRRGKKS
jgi:hypothetical protein